MPNNYTKESIKKAFITLLNERPLNKISIRSIVDICNISRNTFYYHYQDVPKLLEEIIIEAADALIEKHPTVDSIGECIDEAFHFAQQNKKAIYHIYHSVDRGAYESFLMKMCDHVAHTHINTLLAEHKIPEREKAALIHFMKCECFGVCIDWTENGMNDNIVEEYRTIVDMFLRVYESMYQKE